MNRVFSIAKIMGPAPPKYEPLNEQADDEEETQQGASISNFHNNRQTLRLKVIGLGLCLGSLVFTFLILVVFGIILYSIVTHIQPNSAFCGTSTADTVASPTSSLPKPGTFTCGTTADEARALGCQWDIMTMSWEHPDCFDADLTHEFEELGPWTFYHSSRPGKEVPESEMLSPIPYDQVSEQTERMWTDRRYHITHCIYAWKMMHRAVERGWKMQGELASYHHTEHCSSALANTSVPMDAIITKANVQFPTC